ncbi:MAG: hypothetical protein AB1697_11190, partial [Pseudomonadota bacterium]
FIYTVRTRAGLIFHLEAASLSEAESRARSPVIGQVISRMIVEAVSQIEAIEPHRGPAHNKLVFEDQFFQK